MKELSIEEKARRYDEALERTSKLINEGCLNKMTGEFIFPELKESEDERIKKEIINYFKCQSKDEPTRKDIHNKWIAWLERQKTSEEALQYLEENHSPSEVSDFQAAMNIAVAKAYDKGYNNALEKQGEQKIDLYPLCTTIKEKIQTYIYNNFITDEVVKTDVKSIVHAMEEGVRIGKEENKSVWSKEDMKMIGTLVAIFEVNYPDGFYKVNPIDTTNMQGIHSYEIIKWLKSIKERVQPQSKQEWSEEDEKIVLSIKQVMNCAYLLNIVPEKIEKIRIWLKSLKDRVHPQNKWKESLATADLEKSLCDIQDTFPDTSYEYRTLGEAIEFIRCTEPKPQWKPSDEQIAALDTVYKTHGANSSCRRVILNLLNDLKGLKGKV